jgi:hypothetical protein
MLPLDDSYIHLQYARQLAHLEVFAYTHGADPSGGATSPLWIILLAPFFLLGLKGVLGAVAAFGVGTAIWTVSSVLVGRIALRATESASAGFAASLLFMLNGHLLWNFVNGMETGPFALLVLVAIHSYSEWDPRSASSPSATSANRARAPSDLPPRGVPAFGCGPRGGRDAARQCPSLSQVLARVHPRPSPGSQPSSG